MKEVTIKLYQFDELSDEAKRKAHENWLSKRHGHFWFAEVVNTLEKLEEELGIKVTKWQYDSCGHDSGTIRFTRYTDDQLALAGERARAFLWNNFGHLVMQPRRKWYAKNVTDGRVDYSGTVYCSGDWRNRWRESKIFFDRTYDGTCPLTGVCFDNDALDPLAYFCLGVKWDEKEKRRVMVPHDERWRWKSKTVEDVVRECVDALLESAQKDCEYQESEEYFEDFCDDNDMWFHEDGSEE